MTRREEKEVLSVADYTIRTHATVRQTAKEKGIGKTLVHKYLVEYLPELDYERYLKVRKILDENKEEAPKRGGKAVQVKWKEMKQKENGG